LADMFIMLDIPFHSDEAKEINKNIFETMYHASLERSNEIAIERFKKLELLLEKIMPEFINYFGYENNLLKLSSLRELFNIVHNSQFKMKNKENQECLEEFCHFFNEFEENIMLNYNSKNKNWLGAYSSFDGSPTSKGILQFDMWNVAPSDRYDWNSLKQSIVQHGIRNSLLVTTMPTASTSQILGYNECFEPLTSNIYLRRTLAGEFIVINKYLTKELIELGLWNEQIKNNIIANKGSIQQLTTLPEHIRNKYKIAWEIPMKHLIDMSADRGAFICQSQSLNLWIEEPSYNSLTSMHFYSWKKGLKTGIYYLRRKAKHQAQQFTIEPENKEDEKDETREEICHMCSA